MRKYTIAFILMTFIAVGGVLLISPPAEAARNWLSSDCWGPAGDGEPDDLTFFPYGFLCGTDGRYEVPSRILPHDAPGSKPAGTTLSFSNSFSGTGTPRSSKDGPKKEVLLWVVIDGNDSVILDTDVSPGGVKTECPGNTSTNSNPFGTVYGFRDTATPGQPGQSPFAYKSSTGEGRVTCGTEGRMVYWANASEGTYNHSFNVKTRSTHNPGGEICIRQYVSVRFNDSEPYFVSDVSDNGYEGDRNAVSSHIVKRSNNYCYTIEKSPNPSTPSGSTNPACTSTVVTADNYFSYVTFADVTITGATGDTSGRIRSTSATPGITSGYIDKHTFNYTPTSNGAIGVNVKRYYFYNGPDEKKPYKPQYASGTVVGNRKSNTWYQYSDGTTGVAGPCYSSYCTIDRIDTNGPGGKALPGSTVTFHATIYNNAVNGSEMRNGITVGGVSYPLALENHGSGVPAFNSSVPSGRNPINVNSIFVGDYSNPVSFTVAAPASGTLNVGARTAYVGYFGFGSACTASVDVYDKPQIPVVTGTVTCVTNITGNAYHPEAPSVLINVAIFTSAGLYLGTVPTDGAHNFSIPIGEGLRNGLDYTFHLYALDPFGYANSDVAVVTMVGCGKYTLTPAPNGGRYLPTNEDPTSFQGGANISDEYPGWVNTNGPDGGIGVGPVTADYRYLRDDVADAIGRYEIKPYTKLPDGRFVDRSYSSPANIEPMAVAPGFQAGTEYCLFVRISHKSGYVDRTGQILSNDGPREENNCDKIVNEPTFTVNNGSVITGGDYQSGGAGSCTGGGTLGGWFNNTLSQYRWGSGSQLAALGLTKTTGFASARTEGKRAPTDLSFANSPAAYVGNTSDAESPSLGGNYGGSYCLPTIEAETAAEDVSGNLSLGGEVLATGQKKAYFRKGNVYIGGNITYNTTGWSYDKASGKLDKVPSMVVKATGNIYISNNVTRLDGVYIAQRKDPTKPPSNTNGGIIYTCGTASYQPVTSNAVYHNCRNQLTVYGTFVANKVNMMRTYGSLRDEKPIINKGVPAVNFEMTFVGNTAGKNCVKLYEPWAKFWTAPYDDNYLCVPTSANVGLSWTYAKGNSSIPVAYGNANPAGVTPSNCVRVHSANWTNPSDVVPSATMAGTWSDNELCASVPITLSTNGTSTGASCTSIMEPGDPNVDASGTRIWLGNVKLCNDGSSTKKVISEKSVNLYRFACTGTFHKYSFSTTLAGCKNEGSLGGVLPTKSNGSDKAICTQESVGAPCIAHGYGFSAGGANLRPVHRIYNNDSGEYLYTTNTGAALDTERAGYQATLVFYLYTGADFGGIETITTIPASVDPPATPLTCSNKGTPSTASTCAAEVYYYTPELYLAEPKIKRTTNAAGDGPIEIDSMTSLPPVL